MQAVDLDHRHRLERLAVGQGKEDAKDVAGRRVRIVEGDDFLQARDAPECRPTARGVPPRPAAPWLDAPKISRPRAHGC